ncbi:hypothetical protein [Kocuria flava]|uniref:Uncharacterized protein n=1 Tax=Kocuria flava TaxID=446860 RepID=A0ABQ0X678_9MICC|nr:hypothetical protein [Kocuria flava]GEO93101.1 hypothetical protein KFL01_24070 [Kocuria flava]
MTPARRDRTPPALAAVEAEDRDTAVRVQALALEQLLHPELTDHDPNHEEPR